MKVLAFIFLLLLPVAAMSQNKVGINTTAPIGDLDVRGTDDGSDGGELQLATPNMTNFIRMFGGRMGDPHPFLAFSDLDTFHFVTTAANWLTFTRRMTITPSGNIGIGIDRPLAKLDIRALGDGAELLRFTTDRPWVLKQTSTGISTALTLQSTTNDKAFQIVSEDGLNRVARFFTNNAYSKVSLVPESGEVGIGILEATAKLHVRGNSTTNDPQFRLTETSTTDFARIKMENENEPGIFWDIAALADSSASLSKINFYYGNPGFTGDKMTITGEGNVGIGTTSPGNRLRVNGSTSSSQHVFSAGTNYSGNVHIRAVEGFSTPATGFGIGGFMQGGSKGLESMGSGGNFSGTVTGVEGYALGTAGTRIGIYGWATGGATNWAARFGQGNVWIENNIRVDGNVGIGTATPATALDVNGKIKVGNDADAAQAGMIRWNAATSDFEGYDGTKWLSLTSKGLAGGWGTPFIEAVENAQGIASDGGSGDAFGSIVSISGNYAIIGSPLHNTNGNAGQGKAYIYFNNGSTWTQQAILTASNGMAGDAFGTGVAIDDDYAIVGAPSHKVGGNAQQGRAYIFTRNGTTWSQQTMITSSDGNVDDFFGKSVAIDGEFAIIGATGCDYGGHTSRGKAYVFERNGSTWSQLSILTTTDGFSGDAFGGCVSISGAYAVVGAPNHDTNGQPNRGKAYVYIWTGPLWNLQATLVAEDGAATDFFGQSCSISGDYIISGAAGHDTDGYSDQGKAYIYKRNGTTWPQQISISALDGVSYDSFGSGVSIDGDIAVIGAPQPDGPGVGGGKGQAYIFQRNGTTWVQKAKLKAADGAANDDFGFQVSVSGHHCIAGARNHDTGGSEFEGKVYFFNQQ